MKKIILGVMMFTFFGVNAQANNTPQSKEKKEAACCQKSGKECTKEKKEACSKGKGCCKADKKKEKSESGEVIIIESEGKTVEIILD